MSIKDDFLTWIQDQETLIEQLRTENQGLKDQLYRPPLWGANTHMFNSSAYSNSKVIAGMVYSLKMNSIRTGLFVDATGNLVTDLNTVYMDMAMCGIQISPLIEAKGLSESSKDLKSQYDAGYRIGSGFGKKYGKLFNTVEIGNELALKCLMPGKSGKDIIHYYPDKMAAICNYVKGMNDGLKSTAPQLKTIINGEWLHFGFHHALEDVYNVRTDILAWHWYTNQDADIKTNPGYNANTLIEDELARVFPDRKIIFNEVGFTPGKTTGFTPEQQRDKLVPLLSRLKSKNYDVHLYELIDEGDRPGNEGTYGLFDSKYKPKLIIEPLKAL